MSDDPRKNLLCVGGPIDGQRKDVVGQCLIVPVRVDPIDENHPVGAYRLEHYAYMGIRCGETIWWIMRHKSLTDEDVFQRLIDGYRPANLEEA